MGCEDGREACGGGCVDTDTSSAHCGSCGTVCEIGCFEGTCIEVVQVAGGELHTCALLSNGEVWCWGKNNHPSIPTPSTMQGQLGDGTTNQSSRPVRVLNVEDAVQISAGDHTTCAVTRKGDLWCWGDNFGGLVGDGTRLNYRATPVQTHSLFDVVQVAVGGFHVCARTVQKEV